MKIMLPNHSIRNGADYSNKRLVRHYSVCVINGGKVIEVIRSSVYCALTGGEAHYASVCYATFHAHDRSGKLILCGHGKAGGSGYNKVSASIDSAISSAGIATSSEVIDVQGAFFAIAKALGYSGKPYLVTV